MNSTLKIMSWNANGLLQHQQELQAVLDTEKVDVCLISETHFTKQSFIKFRGYKVYHTIHPANSAKGGSAVIIKETIHHYEETKYETEGIQATAVCIKARNYSIVLAGIYCPPKHQLKKYEYLEFLGHLGKRFIVGGDFNAKNTHWGSRLTTTKGRELLRAIQEARCEALSTGKPTYWPTDPGKIPDLIDFFIIKNIPANYLQIEESHDLNSDHSPILLILSEKIVQKVQNPVLTNRRTDWESFRQSLEEKINLLVPLRSEEQLDREVQKLIVDIQQSAWENTPEIKRRLKGNNYPKEIRELIAEKRKTRRRWQKTRAPQVKTELNNLTQQLKREIKELKNDSVSSYLRELTNDNNTDYSLWKATKKTNRPTMQTPPIRTTDGKWARSNEQKAQRFADHLEHIFQPHESQIEKEKVTEEIAQEYEEIKLTTPTEVKNAIKNNINPKKAPGFDLITGEVLLQLPEKAIVKITNLINAAFRLKYVPRLWKVAEVIMIPKPGKPPHEASSYRPISLLPVMSKLFEKLLIKRLKPIIVRKNLIPDHQFGFRSKHSTIDQVHRITNVIEKVLEEKKVCAAIFLDVAQAFDKVWHEGLACKLKTILPKQYTEILDSYLTERFFRIKQGDAYSELKEINAGVPQGSVLGPVLYLLYTSDLPKLENNTVATFADDTAILAVGSSNEEATEKLQTAIDQMQKWTKKWRIHLNESKSVHVNFTNRRFEHIPVNINNQRVPYANTAKYLGMTLDTKLRWKAHVKKKREELGLRYKKMHWLLGRNSSLSLHNKLLLYNQILKPVWTYGIQLWGCTKPSNVDIIQRFQNKVLRNIVDAPWFVRNSDLHRDLGVDVVGREIQRFAQKHEERLHQHENVEAIQLLDNTDIVRRLQRKKPYDLVK